MSLLYFAYGSNLYSRRIFINCPSARFKTVAELKKYKLLFVDFTKSWKGAKATITESNEDSVWGAVWEISRDDEPKLDKQEIGYKSLLATVSSPEFGDMTCKTYICLNSKLENINLPSVVYKDVIIKGAIEHNLPAWYIEKLKSLPDNGYNGPVDIQIQ